jgi:hypothetical protein
MSILPISFPARCKERCQLVFRFGNALRDTYIRTQDGRCYQVPEAAKDCEEGECIRLVEFRAKMRDHNCAFHESWDARKLVLLNILLRKLRLSQGTQTRRHEDTLVTSHEAHTGGISMARSVTLPKGVFGPNGHEDIHSSRSTAGL